MSSDKFSDKHFTADFSTQPYWWDALPRPADEPGRLPASADVVVVGAGLTGCSAAATLARGGRDVVVIEAEHPGFGASTRSAGFLSRHFKHSLTDLLKKHDEATSISYLRQLELVYDYAARMIKDEGLDCALQETGRFIAAMSDADFDVLRREYALRERLLQEEYTVVPDGGRTEYRSRKVVGGILLRNQASLHPGLYAHAMARRATEAGAALVSRTRVTGVRNTGNGFVVSTSQGDIRCSDVIAATNGYSGNSIGWLKRSLIPIRGFMVATEPLPAGLMKSLLPHNRTYTDRRKASNYLRPSPDGTRIIFGGQTGANLAHRLDVAALRIRQEMVSIFPEMEGIKLSHVWTGQCAATIDMIPKIGCRDGVHFALAYCFSGNALAPFFGHQVAMRILGAPQAKLPFEARRLHPIPLYSGNPWFLPIVKKYYELVDRLR